MKNYTYEVCKYGDKLIFFRKYMDGEVEIPRQADKLPAIIIREYPKKSAEYDLTRYGKVKLLKKKNEEER